MKQTLYIFFSVLLGSFLFHLFVIAPSPTLDKLMWTNQVRYFMTQDPRLFDFSKAYGHPGTTLIELGCLFHLVFKVSYQRSLELTMAVLTSGITACCAVFCHRLYPRSLWWLLVALTLSLHRFYFHATPPVAVAMLLVVLIVLVSWWLWTKPAPPACRPLLLWGGLLGISAATRLDATLLVGGTMFILLCYRHGRSTIWPTLVGGLTGFILADPFMWYMPLQHLTDLVHKFTMHYENYKRPMTIEAQEWLHTLVIFVISFCWATALYLARRMSKIVPLPIMAAYLMACVIAACVILTSSYQATRYFYPLILVWEVLLPLFILETFLPEHDQVGHDGHRRSSATAYVIVILVALAQLLPHLIP